MSDLPTAKKRIRKSFGRIPEVTEMPNLIEVQRQSYDNFLQMHIAAPERELVGLEEVFRSVFPIETSPTAPRSISSSTSSRSRSTTSRSATSAA